MNKKVLVLGAVALITLGTLTGCASLQRGVKSLGSEMGGGLNRVITVYSLDGNKVLAEYEGKIDVRESESKVVFYLNGKRTVIYNATIISQEK